ncbi:Acetyl-coenzyme A ligase [Planctomycetes bacterium Poly30]|uniref:Acetyl-coenzyme A synthetase n=1 Tax=Saltatorellus ferox TaxID=2528018 RepID=A0A518ERV5_9BACT|nr:Acetyl-coenzyme A ligase [Planctomycetes bacterium Poly30]
MSDPKSESIESVLAENRSFHPPKSFAEAARIGTRETYERMWSQSIDDPERFWGRIACELPWLEPFDEVLDWSDAPVAKWFGGGKINASHVCLDQHLETERADKVALIFEGEPMGDGGPEIRTFTYAELHGEVCRFANVLKARGIGKGDRVAIYMPMIPEAAMAMLACARIGAIHSVVFGGFSATSLEDRILDGGCKAVITADGGWRRGTVLPLKPAVDEAIAKCEATEGGSPVETVLCVQRCGNEVDWTEGRDFWLHDELMEVSDECEPEPMDSEDVLFLLYTSGSTGKPKGIVHTTGGYMVGAYLSTRFVFDLQEDDVYWCTADIGWITGHTYIVYGPLANGATMVMYEGAPNAPHEGRFWEICERHKVSVFYTAPTAIRAFMKWGDEHVERYDLSSLRLLGTVGEPINPAAWIWYRDKVGGGRCPIVDTWWQTETGGIMITPLPGVSATKPGSATQPFFGVDAAIVDENGRELPDGQGGLLAIRKPWPSMLRGIWGDEARFRETYWSKWEHAGKPHFYFPGDGARKDPEGNFWIMGRVDDVLNVSGHRLSTMEIESALVSHPSVVEAAVVPRPDDLTGEAIVAFVIPTGSVEDVQAIVEELRDHVATEIGKLARPAEIRITTRLPKTRSGKIMRRLLRAIAAGDDVTQDTTTLEDPTILDELRAGGPA